MSDSLVRVSRRVEWGARRPAPGARNCRSTHEARAVRHDRSDGVPRAYQLPGLWPPPQSALVRAPSRSADRLSPFHIRPGHIAGPHPLPSRQFQALFDSLFKVLFIFPSRYLFAIGLSPGPGTTGLSPSPAPLSRGLEPGPSLRTLLQTTIRTVWPPDSQVGLFPVRSPLLRESLNDTAARRRKRLSVQPPLVVTRVTEGSHLGQPHAEANGRPISAPRPGARRSRVGAMRCVTPRQTCPRPNGFGCNLRSKTRWFMGFCNSHQVSHFATFFIDARAEISIAESRYDICKTSGRPHTVRERGAGVGRFVKYSLAHSAPGFGIDNDPSAGSPTETLLRLLLPLNDKVQWTSPVLWAVPFTCFIQAIHFGLAVVFRSKRGKFQNLFPASSPAPATAPPSSQASSSTNCSTSQQFKFEFQNLALGIGRVVGSWWELVVFLETAKSSFLEIVGVGGSCWFSWKSASPFLEAVGSLDSDTTISWSSFTDFRLTLLSTFTSACFVLHVGPDLAST
ncbi:hypothetical protein SASPL_156157 [Salvia splendens]|uniref:Uncharacterized protein n=1 Tax=Salvia splendens TaxID=180675 RepID=A0A8X8VX65_SALSN|nr:hypothetical protein SASPL_156157 [Salvia splendens]